MCNKGKNQIPQIDGLLRFDPFEKSFFRCSDVFIEKIDRGEFTIRAAAKNGKERNDPSVKDCIF